MIQFTEQYRKWGDIELDDKQVEAINFALSRQGCIISLQTGLGKTISALVTAKIILDNFDSARVVIVCPVKAKKAFKKEMFKRMNLSKDYVGFISTDEMDFDRYNNRIFLFTDTNIKKYDSLVQDLYDDGHKIVLMIDEAHGLADKNSAFYKVMDKVKALSTINVGITATPLINDLDGLYNIVNFFCPKFLGKKTDFDNRYTIWHLENIYIKGGSKRKVKVLDGYKNLDELNERLKQVMIVRGKVYDLKFSKQFRNLTDAERDVYEKVSSGMLSKGSEERNFSKRMHDLQRFIDRAYEADGELVELVKEYGADAYSTKEEVLISTIKAALSKNYSLVIYASYVDTIERLNKVLKSRRVELGLGRIYNITGSVDIKSRESVEEKINNNDIVLATEAGVESINLQKCNCVILYDIPFSVKSVIQLIGRICRTDTKHPTQYVIFCGVNGTIDEYKYSLMQMHLSAVQRAINVGTDIPLSDISIDAKYIKGLRDELLWKYRGDPIKKKLRKEKKELKEKIMVSTLKDSGKVIVPNKFLIEPIDSSFIPDIKQVEVLYPDRDKYQDFISGKLPFTVLRSSYINFLHSDDGKKLICKIIDGVKRSGNLLLVGNTDLPQVLKDEILNSISV